MVLCLHNNKNKHVMIPRLFVNNLSIGIDVIFFDIHFDAPVLAGFGSGDVLDLAGAVFYERIATFEESRRWEKLG